MDTVQSLDLKSYLINSLENRFSSNAIDSIRKEALNAFENLNFPNQKNEEWRYSNPQNWLKHDFSLENRRINYSLSDFEKFQIPNLEANVLVFVNGKYQESLSKIISHEDEIIIEPINIALEKHSELIKKHYCKSIDIKKNIFTALNTIIYNEGVFIYVYPNKVINDPIILYFISDAEKPLIVNTRNLLIADKGSEVAYVEIFEGNDDQAPYFTNTVTEISVEQNARVKYFKVQKEGNNNYHIGTTEVNQQKYSFFESTTVSLTGSYIRNNLNLILDGENCESHMYGLSVSSGKQLIDNHTLADHQKPNSFSNEIYKSILNDKSIGVFNGKVFVRQDAQKTNAFQSNKSIVLSADAVMNTKPQLEIFADDVKCSHGATVGQLDESMLFYMQARGIGKEKARRLLMQAFANEITDKISIEPLKAYLEDAIIKKLEG